MIISSHSKDSTAAIAVTANTTLNGDECTNGRLQRHSQAADKKATGSSTSSDKALVETCKLV
jgi:hypothetical protein